ncbi:MAG: ATP-dependent exonuclease SbcCD, C subunit-like protein, partial [Candidatus Sericytochromatia bacterium]|nr:ATP-dependent exonuclease SbcCD, C subunit-like protein [Candidatus Sericytochromatia bacterium]
IYSYIRGEYKNEKDEATNASRSVYLRSEDSYSVLLSHFNNDGYGQSITLAQVFWIKNNKAEKFFVVAEDNLNIKEHFSNFGKDISNLKKNLKLQKQINVFESFSEYSNRFRQIFGIRSEKALDLFYQTVSMKSVGNLTEFVRNQMLEKTEVKAKIDELKKRFSDLTQSYTSVQKAKKQLEQLKPLVLEADEFKNISSEVERLNNCIKSLPLYFAIEKSQQLGNEVISLNTDLEEINNKINELKEDLDNLRKEEIEISALISNNSAGKRLGQVTDEVSRKMKERDKKLAYTRKYDSLASVLDIPYFNDETTFYSSLALAKNEESQVVASVKKLNVKRDELKIQLSPLQHSYHEQLAEFESLKNRKNQTQIPDYNLRVRDAILRDLDLNEADLPFVGELLRVKDSERDWEGAVERILHGFGLSILVPDEHYKSVSNYVNRTDMRGRVVYFRVPDYVKPNRNNDYVPDALYNKLEIRPDTRFYGWLENELSEKYTYACCETMEQFQREYYAVTKEGQIKSGKSRHEKDDRRSIYDRKNYVLGWTNVEKLRVIHSALSDVNNRIRTVEDEVFSVEGKRDALEEKKNSVREFMRFTDFAEINWKKDAVEIQRLMHEKASLENSSDELSVLRERLDTLRTEHISPKEEEINSKREEKGKKDNQKKSFEDQVIECNQIINSPRSEEFKAYFPEIIALIGENENLNIKTIDRLQDQIRLKIEDNKRAKNDSEIKLRDSIINRMVNYKREYPSETIEVDASILSLHEFVKIAQHIETDDLPRHEERFKRLLNEETINSIVLFKNQLEIYEKEIEAKIKDINKSLVEIDYNNGTYIKLDNPKTQDKEIRDFKSDLKTCLENITDENDYYSEDKFNSVKAILDRFNSAESVDLSWTAKVTDVRNWFTFTASERWKEDDAEKEFYSDSSGKSGGQKEKLAYTILASALAYQFGLEWGDTKSRSFRFVVIDEAFGRGSDDSTRYGLELFKKLNLQLLIVTPMQKINIIEDYINSVHFVSNQGGLKSVVRNLTKKEYISEKVSYLALEAAK